MDPKIYKGRLDPNRVIRFFNKTNFRVICLFTARAVDCEQLNEPTCGPLTGSTMTAGPITSDFHTLRPFPLESIIIPGAFTKD